MGQIESKLYDELPNLPLGIQTPTKKVVFTSGNTAESSQLTLPSDGTSRPVVCSQMIPNKFPNKELKK